MTPQTRYAIEVDLAVAALGHPNGMAEAWECGAMVGTVSGDILAAIVSACVLWRFRPIAERTRQRLGSICKTALKVADAWTDQVNEKPAWMAPVWGPKEVAAAISVMARADGLAEQAWLKAFKAFLPFAAQAKGAA